MASGHGVDKPNKAYHPNRQVSRDPFAGGGPGPGPRRPDPKDAPGDFDEFMSREGRSYMNPPPKAKPTPYQGTPEWDRGPKERISLRGDARNPNMSAGRERRR